MSCMSRHRRKRDSSQGRLRAGEPTCFTLSPRQSGAVIVVASEVAKRPAIGAVILSLPLVSLFAFVWVWLDTGDKETVAALIYILVRAADVADVFGISGADAERPCILVCISNVDAV